MRWGSACANGRSEPHANSSPQQKTLTQPCDLMPGRPKPTKLGLTQPHAALPHSRLQVLGMATACLDLCVVHHWQTDAASALCQGPVNQLEQRLAEFRLASEVKPRVPVSRAEAGSCMRSPGIARIVNKTEARRKREARALRILAQH